MRNLVKVAFAVAVVSGTLFSVAAEAHQPRFIHVPLPMAYDQFQSIKDPGGPVELNPQPLPPLVFRSGLGQHGPGAVYLNPQPLPPG